MDVVAAGLTFERELETKSKSSLNKRGKVSFVWIAIGRTGGMLRQLEDR